jgi:hypothetical protein
MEFSLSLNLLSLSLPLSWSLLRFHSCLLPLCLQFKDLKIFIDEMVIVDCLYLFRYLFDETMVSSSPRETVLKLIKRIKPNTFIHRISNGSYNSPYFISRFQEALYYFSVVFDMFEANARREDEDMMVFERNIWERGFKHHCV